MSRQRDLGICAGLGAACLAIYAGVGGLEFVGYDDHAYVVHNPMVRQGFTRESVVWALTAVQAANWHPLTLYSHMLDVELFGLDASGPHLVNAALHVLIVWLVFAVMRSATGATWRSAAVAALVAVHPLHVEVVAWVSQRKTLLSALFGWLSIAAYLGHARDGGRGRGWMALCAGCLALALTAKPMLVTLPVLLLLLDFWPLARLRTRADLGRRAREKLLLLIPVVAVALATIAAQRDFDAMAPLRADTLLTSSLPNALLGYAWYALKLLWPSALAVHYPHPYLPWAGGVPPSGWAVLGAAAFVGGATALALMGRRLGWPVFGWLWFVVALIPVIGLVQVGSQAVADRYAYGPLVGLFVIVVWGADALRRRFSVPTAAMVLPAVAALLALGAVSRLQVETWRDSRSLYARALEISPRDTAMLFNLGNALLEDGERAQAERLYRRALAIHPGSSPARLNLAELLRENGELAESIELYQEVLVERPSSQRARSGLQKARAALTRAAPSLDPETGSQRSPAPSQDE